MSYAFIRDHVAAWWSEVFGGPDRYTRELGGYEHMLAKHRGLAITLEQRRRFVALLSRLQNLQKAGAEGAKFWLGVLTELKNRGVADASNHRPCSLA